MYDFLKAIAVANNWIFFYGRSDFENLFNEDEQKGVEHIFLDPVKIKEINSDFGVVEKLNYSGSFMVVLSSDIDEIDYDTRYQNYIKVILQNAIPTIKESLRCDYQAFFDNWESLEVINVLDYNFDGVIITYSVTIDQ